MFVIWTGLKETCGISQEQKKETTHQTKKIFCFYQRSNSGSTSICVTFIGTVGE